MQVWPATFLGSAPTQVERDLCFVIMPFGQPWSARTYAVVSETLAGEGYRCRRADEYHGRVILADIWRGLNEGSVVIADLTSANPNVYYELGLAHVLGKEVISLLQRGEEIPFDQRPFRILHYEDNRDGEAVLRRELPAWIADMRFSTDPRVLLARGDVVAFNEWRSSARSRPHYVRIDLGGVTLRGAVLTGCTLSESDFSAADLSEVEAREALLIHAQLRGAVCYNADLRRANLSEAEAQNADFTKADLRSAVLIRAEFTGALFVDADLRDAVIDRTAYEKYRPQFELAHGFSEIVVERD